MEFKVISLLLLCILSVVLIIQQNIIFIIFPATNNIVRTWKCGFIVLLSKNVMKSFFFFTKSGNI